MLKEAAEARLSLHLSKCHIVGNHMSQLIFLEVSNAFNSNTIGVDECLLH